MSQEVGNGGPGEDGLVDAVSKATLAAIKGEPTLVSQGQVPEEEHCAIVVEVAKAGPAAHIGLQRGDFICSIDGVAAAKVLAPRCCSTFAIPRGEHAIECYFCDSNQRKRFEVADGVSLGVITQPTLAAAKALLYEQPGNWDLLYLLWQKGEWRWLLHFSSLATGLDSWNDHVVNAANAQWRLPCLPYSSSLVRRLTLRCIMAYSEHRLNSPALVLQGAAMMELGMLENGALLVSTFYEQYEEDHTTNFQAVARLYQARAIAAFRGGDEDNTTPLDEEDDSRALLEEAVELFGPDSEALAHVSRLAAAINAGLLLDHAAAHPDHRPAPPTILMPEWGPLRALPGSTWDVSTLQSALAAMQAPQVAVVVLMGGYRCNGPYNGLVGELTALSRALVPAGLLAGVAVVTCHEQPGEGGGGARREWLRNEEELQAEGWRLCALQASAEAYGAWEESLEACLGFPLASSPAVLLLGADGSARLLEEPERVQVELWNLLASAGGVPQLAQE